ncbi:MAG TPA: TIR domain-containing protein, partial [Phototrophicaceae bacterium]|nr:TIR domain-containing protein [Phototrophicaceae bacterium]
MDDVTPQYDVFISYARIDGEPHAAKLERVLPNTWRDKRGINPSQDFTAEIERAIRGSRQMVVCVTPDVTREDSFVRQEVAYAAYLKKPIIVARFEEVPPPLPVFNHTWLDFFKLGWETGLQQLQDWLGRFASGSYVPPPPPAELANDPYREYLGDLYEAIVSYLDQTVIRLIEVAGKATPEAVSVSRRPLLASFKARAGINDEGQLISSVSEGMARYKGRMLLLGEPGAGKTTALMSYAKQRVSERLNDPTQPLPILLRCAEWESSPPMTLETWTAKSTEIEKTAISTLKLQEKLLFLLDGLDELGAYRTEKVMEDGREVERSYDPRKRFLDQILPTSEQVMLSCRVQDYVEIYEQVKLNGAVTLQPLIDEQIQDYLHDLSDLWTALQVDAGLVEIARTPLLLSFFAYGFK